MTNPPVTVIVPCRNEKMFIRDCIGSLLKNDYPVGLVEIIIVDGQSIDGTTDIIKEFSRQYKNIKYIPNPLKTFPAAVNVGVKSSGGDYIIIAGAHALYPRDYISECIKYSIEYNSDNTGGVLETIPIDGGFTAGIITRVLSNKFGVGNSGFRTGTGKIVLTDTVFGGCYKRNVFEKWGLLNENLVSTSDYEFNRRIAKKGAKIILVPSIRITYYTRSAFFDFMKNNFRNGYWAIYPIAFADHFPVSIRHLVPLFFILFIFTFTFLSFIFQQALIILLLVLSVYLFASLFYSFRSPGKKIPNSMVMPLFFILLHLSYGLGSVFGVGALIRKKLFPA